MVIPKKINDQIGKKIAIKINDDLSLSFTIITIFLYLRIVTVNPGMIKTRDKFDKEF